MNNKIGTFEKIITEKEIAELIIECKKAIFPGYFEKCKDLTSYKKKKEKKLNKIISKLFEKLNEVSGSNKITSFIIDLNEILFKDLKQFIINDPSTSNFEQVITSYPTFDAIVNYRIAHVFVKNNIKFLPRYISEYSHKINAIDINPYAKIDEGFFIDHGIGVVIGETSEIGRNVSIYHGVTLGALSVKKNSLSTKRHPTIGNNVVLYANCTILGGDTIINDNTIIGSGAFVVKSVAENSKVYNSQNIIIK